jgi:DNA repair exonuclease SbcCD ATPase subunit
MILKEIRLRNFKSYGNNEQVLTFSESGSLILLSGANGFGKSALKNSISFNLFNKSRGSKKKWSTLSSLPNRINGDLITITKLLSNGKSVEVHRGMSPSILRLFENGVEDEDSSKTHLEDKIIGYVGMDADTFNSFISMSINDFKNFISLSSDDKQMLLDKLFNLEVINILKSILVDLNKINKARIVKYDTEINILTDTFSSIKKSIEKSLLGGDIEFIKSDMISKKADYIELKNKISLVKNKELQLSNDMDSEREQYLNIKNEIKNLISEIDLYKSGKCPTCRTDFNTDHFGNLLITLEDKLKTLELVKSSIESNISLLKSRSLKLSEISNNINKSFSDLTLLLNSYKTKLEQSGDFNTIEIETKLVDANVGLSLYKEVEIYYKELYKILGDGGVKKSIISGVVKPINVFIDENIKKMGLNFQVVLDDSFNACIKQFGVEIDHDTLSTGEDSKINICVLIAYLKVIRNKKDFNVLFLDELFASIDVESVPSILGLLKSFAHEFNINIFVVHHAILDRSLFDRVIKINKNMFSSLEEI